MSYFEQFQSPWYLGSKFRRYWEVYSSCMSQSHRDALTRCQDLSDNISVTLYRMVKGPWPSRVPRSVFKCKVSKSKKSRKRRNKRRRAEKSNFSNQRNIKEDLFILTDDDTLQVSKVENMHIEDDEEISLDPDYLKFMEQNLKHRLKYSLQKRKTTQQIKSDIESDGSMKESTIQEHPDDIRNKEMKKMYGPLAAQVHAKETAMQLSFDRISTLHQPALWPNIPLKLEF